MISDPLQDRSASIQQNAILIAGEGFPLCFSQYHDGIIDAETITSYLIPNAFARFWRPWKRRPREPTSQGLRQRIVCRHRICCSASLLKCCRSKITGHVSPSMSKIGSKTRTSRVSLRWHQTSTPCQTLLIDNVVVMCLCGITTRHIKPNERHQKLRNTGYLCFDS
jgi:hypothetical protein